MKLTKELISMNPWHFLGIDKTDDKEVIKQAYMELLAKYNPETDPDGFLTLRQAYEDAIKEIDGATSGNKSENAEVNKFLDNINEIYTNFEKRIQPELWRAALEADVCIALDTEEEVEFRIMDFISKNHNLPVSVWRELDNKFHWIERADELKTKYHPNFIDNIIFSINNKFDSNFNLFESDALEPDFDRYLYVRNEIGRANDEKRTDDIPKLMEEIEQLDIYHPMIEIEKARYQALLNNSEAALDIILALTKKHPAEYENDPYVLYTKGTIFIGQEDASKWEEANTAFNKALEIVPDYFFAQIGIADVLIKKGEYADAEDYLTQNLLEKYPSSGYIYNYLKNISDLKIMKYEKLCEEDPTQENIETLAESYSNSNKNEECLALLIKPEVEKTGKVCYFIGCCYSRKNELDIALEFALQAIEKDPRHSCFILACEIYFKKRMYTDILEMVDNGLEKGYSKTLPDLQISKLLSDKAYALQKLGRFTEALTFVDDAIAKTDKMFLLYADKGEILLEMGRYQEAFEELQNCISLMPSWARPYELIADIFYKIGNQEQMEETLKQADGLQLKSVGLSYMRACLNGALEKYDECIATLKDLLVQEDGEMMDSVLHEKIIDALCFYSMKAGNNDDAVMYAVQLIDFFDKNNFEPVGYIYSNLFDMCAQANQLQKFEEIATAQLQKHPNNVKILYALARHYESSNKPKGIKTWGEIMQQQPTDPVAYNRIALLYRAENNNNAALDIVNHGLAVIPNNVNLLTRRSFIYTDLNNHQAALDDLLQAVSIPVSDSSKDEWWDRSDLLFEIGLIYWAHMNNADKALEYYFAAEAAGLESMWELSHVADAHLFISKNYDAAIEIYKECIKGDDREMYSLYSLGCTYQEMGKTDKALEIFEQVLAKTTAEASSKDATHDTFRIAGITLLQLDKINGNTKNANEIKKSFDKAAKVVLRDGTKNGECFCISQGYALYYMHIGKYAQALEQIEVSIKISNSVRNNMIKQEIIAKQG